MKLNILFIFISIFLLIKDKSAVEITVTYSVTTVGTATETITDIFDSASTVVEISGELHTVFVDATTASFPFTFNFNLTTQFTRVTDVTASASTVFTTTTVGDVTSTIDNGGGGGGSGTETVTVTSTASGSGSGSGNGSDESDEYGDDDVIIPIITQTKNVEIPGEDVVTNLYVTQTVLQTYTEKIPQKTEFVYTATGSVLKHLRLPNYRPRHGYHPDYDYHRRHY